MSNSPDTQTHNDAGIRRYWTTWAALLLLTGVMLSVSITQVPRSLQLGVLLAAMLAQVALIAGHFMHLRQAHAGLVWTFVAGLLITGITLYVLIAPDAMRIHDMGASR